jgi:hypothetical protein
VSRVLRWTRYIEPLALPTLTDRPRSAALYLGILLGYGVIVLLLFVISVALLVNYMLPSLDEGELTPEEPDDGVPLLDRETPVIYVSDSESEVPPVAGPSSSRQ